MTIPSLAYIDWMIIFLYLFFALAVGLYVSKAASSNITSYFLANRSMPWWLTGTSIAATTFAADTPLAITGMVAKGGLSANIFWLASIGIHAACVFIFASLWRRSEVITDAEFITLRYQGRAAIFLRRFKAFMFGVVFNAIIMGWVIKAMLKIIAPFSHWETWFPRFYHAMQSIWPAELLGSLSQGLTILALLGIVAIYSSAGGIRSVMITDFVQLALALTGSFLLAYKAIDFVGGLDSFSSKFTAIYGVDHSFFDLYPNFSRGWASSIGLGFFTFGIYVLIQSVASSQSPDSGGYMQQRLSATQNEHHAAKAMTLFVFIHYFIRLWPWVVVAFVALVIFPLGNEHSFMDGHFAYLANDREAAYPALMSLLLGPGFLGLVLCSLLAAFMSTIDTHINWGASYLINDLYLSIRKKPSHHEQLLVTRLSVLLFVVIAVYSASKINHIELAWKLVAALGAGLSVPVLLRWFWWRINAWSEICGMVLGLLAAIFLSIVFKYSYEVTIMGIALASLLGCFIGIFIQPSKPDYVYSFIEKVRPFGVWPQSKIFQSPNGISRSDKKLNLVLPVIQTLLLILAIISSLKALQSMLMLQWHFLIAYLLFCIFSTYLAFRIKLSE